jgi:hypothetical protein
MLACGGIVGGREINDVTPDLEAEEVLVVEKEGYCIDGNVPAEPFEREWGITGGVRGVCGTMSNV